MKYKIKDIIKDVVENLKGWKDGLKDLGKEYYDYDRHTFIYNHFVNSDMDRESDGEDIYDTDIQSICTELIQMSLKGQILYSNRDNDKLIDRFKSDDKVSINENKNLGDRKVIESFVWYCFSKLKDDTIRNFITSYREDVVNHFKDMKSKQLNIDSDDEDMNNHNIVQIEKDTEHQKDLVNSTLLQFTDRLGLSKDSWKKMLDI